TNVRRTVADIRARSGVLAGLEKDGKIGIVGSMYHLQGGRGQFFRWRGATRKMTRESAGPASTAGVHAAALPPWGALRYPVFRWLWIATVVSNVGTWMYN